MKNKEAKLLLASIATVIALSLTACTTEQTEPEEFRPDYEYMMYDYGVVEVD